MNNNELQSHIDARFDRIESKIDKYGEQTTKHASDIEHLRGFSKLIITILLAAGGFFAAGYITYLKG